jgi:hypothetical protein
MYGTPANVDDGPVSASAREAPVPWGAFPLHLRQQHDGVAGPAAWRDAERLAVARFVEPTGGQYLFAPSREAVASLDGQPGQRPPSRAPTE